MHCCSQPVYLTSPQRARHSRRVRVNGYLFNRRWTFDARDSTRTRLAYVAVQVAGLGATVALVSALREATDAPGLVVYVAAAGPVTVGMFLANRTWTFGAATRE